MKSTLIVPEKIAVGFQVRADTFTKKLGFVVRYEKNRLTKQVSWDGWRDKDIPHIDCENEPTEGFFVNKGFHRQGYYWGGRDMIRIWDPRGFEFEITPANLTYILRFCDIVDTEIKGSLVYAWDKADLVLLPVVSDSYTVSVEFTKGRGKYKAEKIIPGRRYKRMGHPGEVIYLGKIKCKNTQLPNLYGEMEDRHVFVGYDNVINAVWHRVAFDKGNRKIPLGDAPIPAEKLAEYVDWFYNSWYCQPVVSTCFVNYQDLPLLPTVPDHSLTAFRMIDGRLNKVKFNNYRHRACNDEKKSYMPAFQGSIDVPADAVMGTNLKEFPLSQVVKPVTFNYSVDQAPAEEFYVLCGKYENGKIFPLAYL